MKITVNKDIRNLKQGQVFDFKGLKAFGYITIVGENGCGKSTILQAIRGTYDHNNQSLYRHDFKELAKNFTIETDYEEFLFLDSVKDDGTHFMNASDASVFISSGGFHAEKLSHGQGSLMYLHKFLTENKDRIRPGKTLVVLDEVDGGLSLSNSAKFFNFVLRLLDQYQCHVLIVSHNPFVITRSIVCYDFETASGVSSTKYIEKMTGYVVVDSKTFDQYKK